MSNTSQISTQEFFFRNISSFFHYSKTGLSDKHHKTSILYQSIFQTFFDVNGMISNAELLQKEFFDFDENDVCEKYTVRRQVWNILGWSESAIEVAILAASGATLEGKTVSARKTAIKAGFLSVLCPILPLTFLLDWGNRSVQYKASRPGAGSMIQLLSYMTGSMRLIWWATLEPIGKLVVKTADAVVRNLKMAHFFWGKGHRMRAIWYGLKSVLSVLGFVSSILIAWCAVILAPLAPVLGALIHASHCLFGPLVHAIHGKSRVFEVIVKSIQRLWKSMTHFFDTVFGASSAIPASQSAAYGLAFGASTVVASQAVDTVDHILETAQYNSYLAKPQKRVSEEVRNFASATPTTSHESQYSDTSNDSYQELY